MPPTRTLPPDEALAVLDAFYAHARIAVLKDVRDSFEEALRAHGNRLDIYDVECVLLGLEEEQA